MNKITNADLTPILSADDPEFRALVERFDAKCWARYDLSAMRVGYHYGREPLLARIAELKEERDTTATDLHDALMDARAEAEALREQINRSEQQEPVWLEEDTDAAYVWRGSCWRNCGLMSLRNDRL